MSGLSVVAAVLGPRFWYSGVGFICAESHQAGLVMTWIINFMRFRIVYIVECIVLILHEDVIFSLGLYHNFELK